MWTSKSSYAKPSGGVLLVVGWTNSKSLGFTSSTAPSFSHNQATLVHQDKSHNKE